MIFSAIPIIGGIIDKALSVVDKFVVDKDLQVKLKAELQSQIHAMDFSAYEKELDAKTKIIVAEAQGKSWMQRNWRPVLMLTIVAIIANNYLIYPYLSLFTGHALVLDLPDHLYTLMEIGVGGYIVGRSGEKIAKTWREK